MRDGAKVEQERNQGLELDISLRLAELVRIINPLGLEAYDVGSPVEDGPTPARDRAGVLAQAPVLLDLIFSVQRRQSISRELDLYHMINYISTRDTCQPPVPEHAANVCKRHERHDGVVDDGQHAHNGKGNLAKISTRRENRRGLNR